MPQQEEIYAPGSAQLVYVLMTPKPLGAAPAGTTLTAAPFGGATKKDRFVIGPGGHARSVLEKPGEAAAELEPGRWPEKLIDSIGRCKNATVLTVRGPVKEAFAQARAALEALLAPFEEAWVTDVLSQRLLSRARALALPASASPFEQHLGFAAERNAVVSRGLMKLGWPEVAVACEDDEMARAAAALIAAVGRSVIERGGAAAPESTLPLGALAGAETTASFALPRISYANDAQSWPDSAAIATHGGHMQNVRPYLAPPLSPRTKTLLMLSVRAASGEDATEKTLERILPTLPAPPPPPARDLPPLPETGPPPRWEAKDALTALFREGARIEGDPPFTVACHGVGHLNVTSGEIVAADALAMPDDPPLELAVPKGSHPVFVSVARLENGDERIAAACVVFSTAQPVRWEPLSEHGVDSGTSSFMDASAADALARDEELTQALLDSLQDSQRETWTWANLPTKGRGKAKANVVAFSSGWGDGVYEVFAGKDASGGLVAVLTNFGLSAGES